MIAIKSFSLLLFLFVIYAVPHDIDSDITGSSVSSVDISSTLFIQPAAAKGPWWNWIGPKIQEFIHWILSFFNISSSPEVPTMKTKPKSLFNEPEIDDISKRMEKLEIQDDPVMKTEAEIEDLSKRMEKLESEDRPGMKTE